MKTKAWNLNTLFSPSVVFVVPNYQRLYDWTLQDQWQQLWQDVEDIANNLVKNDQQDIQQNLAPNSVESHFLGAVILKRTGADSYPAHELRVVDGQQRLTTLQLLLAAAMNELERNGVDTSLRSLLKNQLGREAYKIKHQHHSRGHHYASFGSVMAAAMQGGSVTDVDGPLAKCYRYFQTVIREWLSSQQSASLAGAALETTLKKKLTIVGIRLGKNEKEHAIFEALNARSKPLTEWDKINNYLLYKADEDPDLRQDTFFESYLDRFDDCWWRAWVGRGVQRRARTDVFADYWLESRTKTPVEVRRVFREFQNYEDNESQNLELLMQDFVQDARYFRKYEEEVQGENSRETIFHQRRLAMSIGAFWPLLLYLQYTTADQQERERCLSVLESYFVRRWIVGLQARSYDRVALDLIKALSRPDNAHVDKSDVIANHLVNFEQGVRWPKDEEVSNAVLLRNMPREKQRFVLSEIEKRLISEKAGNQEVSRKLHVEHIMPQSPHPAEWPLPDSSDEAKDKRKTLIHTLGNLTLLNSGLNQSISNAAWTTKRSEIWKSDNLFINRHLLEFQSKSDQWVEDDIVRRGQWMSEIVIKIWPTKNR